MNSGYTIYETPLMDTNPDFLFTVFVNTFENASIISKPQNEIIFKEGITISRIISIRKMYEGETTYIIIKNSTSRYGKSRISVIFFDVSDEFMIRNDKNKLNEILSVQIGLIETFNFL
jgi:hypothetical protein